MTVDSSRLSEGAKVKEIIDVVVPLVNEECIEEGGVGSQQFQDKLESNSNEDVSEDYFDLIIEIVG